MPRSKELAFLKAKLAVAEKQSQVAYAVDLRLRIRRLHDDIADFNHGLKKKPW